MAQRADNKDGSCREILNGKLAGKWRVQFTSEDEFGRKSRLSRVFATKTEGKDFLRDLRKGCKIEAAQRKDELTLGAWFDWLVENDFPESLAANTIAARVGRFNKYVRKEWGKVALMRLDALAIKAFYKRLEYEGVGLPTILELKRDLVRLFNLAARPYGRVPWHCVNPFALSVPTPQPRDAVALDPEEARKALASKLLSAKERAMLATYLLAGLRLSEQMALTKGQIMFDKGLIFVDRSVKFSPKRAQEIGLPKGGKKRVAVMCPALSVILREATDGLADDDCLWPSENGNFPRLKRNVYRTWQAIIEKCGLPVDMSPHDCRLSHINWIEKLMPEVSPTTLKEHVGHASGRTVTEINYTRPISAAHAILSDGIERLANPKGTKKRNAA